MRLEYFIWLTVCLLLFALNSHAQPARPHVVFVLADDYGFNDVGYHGKSHGSAIKTPCLDSLAMSGIRLENYYVQSICTPTRSQLMSGRYQIHTGLQHGVILANQPNGLPLENILLPEQLKNCGYDTHMLGKWHLGFFKEQYLPWKRGFDTYFGYLVGAEDYYTKYQCQSHHMCGYSMDSEKGPTNETYGEYSAHLYTRKVKEIVENHNKSNSMFLYVALQSVHSPLQVPNKYVKPYAFIKDENRRTYAGMVAVLDEAVKNITQYLQKAGMWDNTLLIFSTDNGGQTLSGGNNWPLRGRKDTLWEGGVRGVGFVHGKMLDASNTTNNQLMHVSDWYPTLLHATGCPSLPGTQSLDGFDQWKTLTKNVETPRMELLHNIDPLKSKHHKKHIIKGFDVSVHAAIRVGEWKLLTGNPGFDDWVKPPELNDLFITPELRKGAFDGNRNRTIRSHIQLFNIKHDPYERKEVSADYPDIVEQLLVRLAKYNSSAVPVNFPPADLDANPDLHGGFWEPWEK